MLAAGKAVIELLLVIDREGWGLFLVERAETGKFPALPFQLHMPTDHLRYGQAVTQLIEEFRRDAHALSSTSAIRQAPAYHGQLPAEPAKGADNTVHVLWITSTTARNRIRQHRRGAV